MTRFRIGALALVASCVLLVWVLPASATQSTVKVTTITVSAGKPGEFAFLLSKKTAVHGIVNFKVTNKGQIPHDFKISGHKTKLLSPGQSQTLKITFTKAGKYPYLCTVPGHAAGGMHGTFKVT